MRRDPFRSAGWEIKRYKLRASVILILILTSALVLYSYTTLISRCSASDYAVARIVEVDYPKRVGVGEVFQVVVTAEYADSLYVDVCVRDVDRDEIVDALTLISNFHGPGLESYTFNLTAPREVGIWRLEVSTRAWWRGSWYGDEEQSAYQFDVEVSAGETGPPVRALLTLTSKVQGIRFTVDGVEYEFAGDNLTLELEEGLHKLRVEPSIIGFGNGTRLIFSKWSDDTSSNPRYILLPSKGLVLSPIYMRQHRLQVDSPLDFVRGGGWYDEGSEALAEALPEAYKETLLYKFTGWSGDSSSKNHSLRIIMDRPKRVEASWMGEPLKGSVIPSWIITVSVFLLVSSIVNIAIMAAGRSKRGLSLLLLLLPIIFPFHGCAVVKVDAAMDSMPSYKTVGIGDSIWRYWHRMGSDTCLIWLGGGVLGGEVFINPYWLESYNTMRFIQDLSNFYSIIAIEKGSTRYLQRPLNRMVYGESYRGGGFVEEAGRWAKNQGFSQVYIVGYSVGGIAAVEESTIYNPQNWSTPNGVILITTPISRGVLERASRLTGNLLVLYGEHMTPLYVESGKNFFNASHPEGPLGERWIHKEFHLIPETAHEVWTIAETGRYDPSASRVIVEFIEKAKILNHISVRGPIYRELEGLERSATLNPGLEIIQRRNPYPWSIYINGSGLPPNLREFVAYNSEVGPISVSHGFMEGEDLQILLNFKGESLTRGEIRILAFPERLNDSIFSISLNHPVMNLRISTVLPGIPVEVDGVEYLSGPDGQINLNLTMNPHTIRLQRIMQIDDGTRLCFKEWMENSGNETEVTATPETRHLTAVYARQLLLEADSKLGSIIGGGWHDENSLIQLKVDRGIIRGEDGQIYVFEGWHPKSLIGEDETLYLNKSIKIDAIWRRVDEPPHRPLTNYTMLGLLLSPTLILFLATASLVIKRFRGHGEDQIKRGPAHKTRREGTLATSTL
ncbi:MAG: hypothetical protein QW176_06450 [Candidatus Bathyarchaeia archaeon]